MIYKIKRFFKQLRRLLRWIPVVWDTYDFDYSYSLKVFKFQLERQADFMESKNAKTLNAKHYASRIRIILRLMDKVYNEDYGTAYFDQMEEKYGEGLYQWVIDYSDSPVTYAYEVRENAQEIEAEHKKLQKLAAVKQKRAHKLLWDLVEHNIQTFWD